MTIVTLIHGTWARKADWVREDSPLARALREQLNDEVTICTFRWSGHNLHASRLKAAAALQEHIRRQAELHPGARQYLVAHSHGGNVCLYALRDPRTEAAVTGVVCLSTPFIQCRPRVFPKGTGVIFAGVGLGLVGVAALLAFPDSFNRAVVAFFLVSGLLAGIGTAVFKAFFGIPLDARLAGTLGETLRLADLPAEKLLILRATGDEASAALGVSLVLAWVLGKVSILTEAVFHAGNAIHGFAQGWSWPRRIAGAVVTTGAIFLLPIGSLPLIWGVGLACALVYAALSFLVPAALDKQLEGGVPTFFRISGRLLLVLYGVILSPFLLLSALCAAAFGWDLPLAGGVVDLSAETTPIGDHRVIHLRPSVDRALFQHSVPYADSAAFRAIAAWAGRHGGAAEQKGAGISDFKFQI